MVNTLRQILIFVSFMCFVPVVLANSIEGLSGIFDQGVSLEEKLGYLNKLKNESSSFEEYDYILMTSILENSGVSKEEKILILEILLKDDIKNIDGLEETLVTLLENNNFTNYSSDLIFTNKLLLLALKVLIKTCPKSLTAQYYVFFPLVIIDPMNETYSKDIDLYENFLIKYIQDFPYNYTLSTGDYLKFLYSRSKSVDAKISYLKAMSNYDMKEELENISLDKTIDEKIRSIAQDLLKNMTRPCNDFMSRPN